MTKRSELCCDILRGDNCETDCALRHAMRSGKETVNKNCRLEPKGGRSLPISITAQPIKTADEGHAWSDTYDRNDADVFAVQSDIVQRIASSMETVLSPAEKASVEEIPCPSSKSHPAQNCSMNCPNCLLVRSHRPDGGTNGVKKNCTVAVRIAMR